MLLVYQPLCTPFDGMFFDQPVAIGVYCIQEMIMLEQPTWEASKDRPRYTPLDGDRTVDVLIIGGGLTGVITAYQLAESGKQVLIIEADSVGAGATGYTTAFITQVIDTNTSDLVRLYGSERTRGVWQSGGAVIDWYEQTIKREKIECDFVRCPSFIYANRQQDLAALAEEANQAKGLDFPMADAASELAPLPIAGAMRLDNQAKFHPLKFLSTLAAITNKRGVEICENTKAESIEGTGPLTITTNHGVITTTNVVIATYAPFHNPAATRAKKGAYTSYVYELELPSGSLPEAIYEDLDNPYHYFRVDRQKGHDRVILGGEDHRQELNGLLERKSYERLKDYAQHLFADYKLTIKRRWAGQILESVDGLPFIGPIAPHQYVATAFSGNGMTYAAIAGKIISDEILGKHSEWASLYSADRTPTVAALLTKGRDFGGEFWNGAVKKVLGL